MKNFIFDLNFGILSDHEKQNCIETAKKMVKLTYFARENGILSLENEVLHENQFIKTYIALLTNGVDFDEIKRLFNLSLLCNKLKYVSADLLERFLVIEGLFAINNRYSPFVVTHIMSTLLGDEHFSEIQLSLKDVIDTEKAIDEHTTYFESSEKFETTLLNMKTHQLSSFLIKMDDTLLSLAFKGCSKSFIRKMGQLISENNFIQICDTFQFLLENTEDDILEHQNIILKMLNQV